MRHDWFLWIMPFASCLHKVCGEVLVLNDQSIKYHLGLECENEEVFRADYCEVKVYHNIICFGLLSFEWTQSFRGGL